MDRWNIRKYKLIFVTYFGLWTYIAIDGARRVGLIRDPRLIFFPIGETRSKLTDPNMNNQGKGYPDILIEIPTFACAILEY